MLFVRFEFDMHFIVLAVSDYYLSYNKLVIGMHAAFLSLG